MLQPIPYNLLIFIIVIIQCNVKRYRKLKVYKKLLIAENSLNVIYF
jgi:hypothetical protein